MATKTINTLETAAKTKGRNTSRIKAAKCVVKEARKTGTEGSYGGKANPRPRV